MNFKKIYKLIIIFIFLMLAIFKTYIIYDNKIFNLTQQLKIEKSYSSFLASSIKNFQKIKKLSQNAPNFGWPMQISDYEKLTDWFGLRDIPTKIYTGGSLTRFHSGIDIRGYEKARIVAIADGIVIEHWLPTGYHHGVYYSGDPILGGKIIIDHQNGWFSVYGHMSITYVREGQKVKKGETIGRQGNTGMSTGPHLHFELWKGWHNPVQPLRYIKDPNYY